MESVVPISPDADADATGFPEDDSPPAPPPDAPHAGRDVPTEEPPPAPPVLFSSMKLITPLMQAIDVAGYKHTTPVQAAVRPCRSTTCTWRR